MIANPDKIQLWARERRSPLFRLTDPKKKSVFENVLVLYEKNLTSFYDVVNERKRKTDKKFNYFLTTGNFLEFERLSEEMLVRLRQVDIKKRRKETRKISESDLEKEFFASNGFLDHFFLVYGKTESRYQDQLEKLLETNAKEIDYISKKRFELRKESKNLFSLVFGVLLNEIARRRGLRAEDLFFYTYDELKFLIVENKQVSRKEIEERKKGYILIFEGKTFKIYSGKRFSELRSVYFLSAKKAKEIIGKTAMRGKVVGKVRVISCAKKNLSIEMKKFNKGEILVTEMTKPDFAVICRKASAIITDEGGVACHAALIAREFGVPCVVGTHEATQILKTGDIVEVDADAGKIVLK